MNLWVRSQDKEKLTKINNRLFIKEITNMGYSIENDLCCYDGFVSLGIYKTRERAIEVLDEIQRLLEKDKFEEDRYCCDKLTKAIVYEMPKD